MNNSYLEMRWGRIGDELPEVARFFRRSAFGTPKSLLFFLSKYTKHNR